MIVVFASPPLFVIASPQDEAIQLNKGSKSMSAYFYILFNERNGTLYVGVTSDLIRRVYEHKNKMIDGFTKKYNVDKLGYYEAYQDIVEAIKREKAIKGSSRKRKLTLIEGFNPKWEDLYEKIL